MKPTNIIPIINSVGIEMKDGKPYLVVDMPNKIYINKENAKDAAMLGALIQATVLEMETKVH